MADFQLIYTSKADEELEPNDLLNIVATSKEFNAQKNISGILCYGFGHFLQAIEGDQKEVHNLFGRIQSDSRNRRVKIVGYKVIKKREFTDWDMIFIEANTDPHVRSLLKKYVSTTDDEINPFPMLNRVALEFLKEVRLAYCANDLKLHNT